MLVPARSFRAKPFADWPRADRRLWLAGTEAADPLEQPGAGVRWRPATRSTVLNAYGTALQWLDDHGWLEPSVGPAARWTAPRLGAYIDNLIAAVRPATARHRVVHLERALAILDPESDRSILHRAINNLARRTHRARKRARLREPGELVALGFSLMNMADAGRRRNARRNATDFRVGLQIALMALRPLRMKNFAAIRIGTHLVQERQGAYLLFEGGETKNHRPIEVRLPEDLIAPLDRYIRVYRPLLAGGRYRGDRLWLSYRFKPQSAHTIQLTIVRATGAAFGRSINPHLFRDCAATSIAINDPVAIRMAATILGHASFSTTEKHYNLARSLDAGRLYADHLTALRAAHGGKQKVELIQSRVGARNRPDRK